MICRAKSYLSKTQQLQYIWKSELCGPYVQCMYRVWKGILGMRDLTQIRYRIRENAKYLDGIRDLTAPREAGFAKI